LLKRGSLFQPSISPISITFLIENNPCINILIHTLFDVGCETKRSEKLDSEKINLGLFEKTTHDFLIYNK